MLALVLFLLFLQILFIFETSVSKSSRTAISTKLNQCYQTSALYTFDSKNFRWQKFGVVCNLQKFHIYQVFKKRQSPNDIHPFNIILLLKVFDFSKETKLLATVINVDFPEKKKTNPTLNLFPFTKGYEKHMRKTAPVWTHEIIAKAFSEIQLIKWVFGQPIRMNNSMVKMRKLCRGQSGGKWKLHLAVHGLYCSRQRK